MRDQCIPLNFARFKLEPGTALAKSVMGDKDFAGFQNIMIGEMDLLKEAVRAAKDQ